MKVTFVLPSAGARPTGGFKVVYEYANALVGKGHEVAVVHPAIVPGTRGLSRVARSAIGYLVRGVDGRWRPYRWFSTDERVRMLWIPSLHPRFVPDADVIVASSWRTAETMAFWPASKGRKHYLIQHLETWDGPSDRVLATWRLPYRKIVIAQWLAEFARELGESFHYVPNGLDAQSFGIDTRPEDRNPHSVAMLYHTYAWKGSQDGIAALELARQEIPDLTATLFGTSARPADMPAWIRYLQDPPQQRLRALYNESAIFVAPSWAEGWPLPPAEAMACGCSLACTDIGGHREYAHDGLTALLSAPKAPLELARNVVTLATNQELRLRLSAGGKALIDQFTWERAATRLQAALREGIDAADMSAS